MKTLNKVQCGNEAKIMRLDLPREIKIRLNEMGLTENTSVKVIKKAPFGDPIEILVRGYKVCLRKSETSKIFVETK